MDKETRKPSKGTWDNLGEINVLPVKFEINMPVICEFLCVSPLEKESQYDDDSVYYSFEVIANGSQTIINTGAWSLLRELKAREPLKGKKLQITKRLNKGKQEFEVKDL